MALVLQQMRGYLVISRGSEKEVERLRVQTLYLMNTCGPSGFRV